MIRNSPAKQGSPVVTTPTTRAMTASQTPSASSSPTKLMVPENLTIKQREQIQMALNNYTTPELVVVKMGNGRLKITAKDSIVVDDPIDTMKKMVRTETCIKCKRQIDGEELFFHLPIDPDRRRTWGKILGLSYEKMMSSTASDTICSDHFTDACLSKYGYNKTSVETHGEPYNTDLPNEEMSSYGSHMNCCIKWQCTLCKFHSRSVIVLREHVLKEHLTGAGERKLIRDLQDGKVNLLCPFCRKTGYGYKTVSGFLKHLQTHPGEHLYLKRIAIKAQAKCRMQFLEPGDKWESWTEDNIVLAMYGALMHKIKRKIVKSEVELASPLAGESKSRSPESVKRPLVLSAMKSAEKSVRSSPSIVSRVSSIQSLEPAPKISPPPVLQQVPKVTTALIVKKIVTPTTTTANVQEHKTTAPDSSFVLPTETKTGELITVQGSPPSVDQSGSPKLFSPTRPKLGYVDFAQKLKSLPSSPAAKRFYREGPASHSSSPVHEYTLKKNAEAAAVRMRLFGGDGEIPGPSPGRLRLAPKEPKIESSRLLESPRKDPQLPPMPLEAFINEAVSASNNTPSKNRKSREEMKILRAQQQPSFPVGNPVFISIEDVASNFGRNKQVLKRTYSSSTVAETASCTEAKNDKQQSSSQPLVTTAEMKEFANRRIISKKARQNLFGYMSSDEEGVEQKPAPKPVGQVRQVIVRKAIHGKPTPLSQNPTMQRKLIALRTKSGLPMTVEDAIQKADVEVNKLRCSPVESVKPSVDICPSDPPSRSVTKKIRILRSNKPPFHQN
uniref:THAP-type domain-containing protein n=1 Tax=Steinernema glaseri TaxID=37863 RepID=A0A1I8AQB9_9BILA